MYAKIWSEQRKERNRSESLGTVGKILKVVIKYLGWEGVSWTYLAQHRKKLWDKLKTVSKLRVP